MKGEVSLIEKDNITGGNDEYMNAVKVKKTAQQTEGVKDISCSNLNTYYPTQIGQRKSNEIESEGFCFEKSQHSSSFRVLSELDDCIEESFESILGAGKTCNKTLSRKGSLECIEWSGEERVFSPEAKSSLSKIEFYSNWKNIINQQDAPRTPQFKTTYIFPLSPHFSDYDEYYSDSSSNSSESLPDIQKEIPTVKKSKHIFKNHSRRVNGISWNQYEGANEANYNYSSPSLPIPNNLQGRNRLDLLLSQWVNYFSGRQTIDINDIECATQFFTGLDVTTLTAVTSSLIYIGHCARYTQIRKYNQG
ncbi:uncharacterized protein cubi_00116 [Cryptosporidium ubiquitum]|uniref:Uncharacterized protein n=1 Tax=Cryptosporidium ubiquitum TaxID=857276 RepID=A0A1J4MM78_9CRYT|nr:uncharacterized protein cubi_00116 [Cryptosporidium ubiquitum]OII74563.1 hypothetical protein cubi_00116 [Cryptosporidium ubiquitum]